MRRPTSLKVSVQEFEDNPPEDLRRIGEYITRNIKSERKNIINLYSTSIQLMKDVEDSPVLSKRRGCSDSRELESPVFSPKHTPVEEMINDMDLVVSNHFPSKAVTATTKAKVPIFERRWQQPVPT